MKNLWTLFASLIFSPNTILGAVANGLWHIAITAFYLWIVSLTVSALNAAMGHIHWLLWTILVSDEALIWMFLAKHFCQSAHLVLGQLIQHAWTVIKEFLKTFIGRS